jgi:hypothetical protein
MFSFFQKKRGQTWLPSSPQTIVRSNKTPETHQRVLTHGLPLSRRGLATEIRRPGKVSPGASGGVTASYPQPGLFGFGKAMAATLAYRFRDYLPSPTLTDVPEPPDFVCPFLKTCLAQIGRSATEQTVFCGKSFSRWQGAPRSHGKKKPVPSVTVTAHTHICHLGNRAPLKPVLRLRLSNVSPRCHHRRFPRPGNG